MTPYQLDCIVNGAKVFIYKRFDGTIYASVHDFDRFGVKPIETVRVKLDANSTVEAVENDPAVARRVSALSRPNRTTGDGDGGTSTERGK